MVIGFEILFEAEKERGSMRRREKRLCVARNKGRRDEGEEGEAAEREKDV